MLASNGVNVTAPRGQFNNAIDIDNDHIYDIHVTAPSQELNKYPG